MKIPQYRETPPGIMFVLNIFTENNISYVLFKCDHIFEGQNKNLDILFETNEDYSSAARILQEQGFVIRLSEKIERYKTMYCSMIDGIIYSVHLHREIAWHGMIALDKMPVFEHAQHLNQHIIIPGMEDSILIHAAHVLFENFKVKEREKKYFLKLNMSSEEHLINREYINWQIRKNHWEDGFWKVIKSEQLSKINIGKVWINKSIHEPGTAFYLFKKALRIPLRKLSFKRRGCLIALIGVNGSGKSTLAKRTLEEYLPITSHLGKKQYYYYFGWKPTFILTRWLSTLFKKRKKEIFKEVNIKTQVKKFDFRQELQFIYIYLEFMYRYCMEIRPLLKNGNLTITDRYFYDIYGQYPYARNSLILKMLMGLFPTPTVTYHLTIDLKELQKRKKTDRKEEKIQSNERTVFPEEYLKHQQENYFFLVDYLKIKTINTNRKIQENINMIIKETWKKLL